MPFESNRRDFLRGLSGSVALAATAGFAGGDLLSAAETQANAREDRELRLGIIGLGGRGRGEAVMISLQENARVTAVCDTDPKAIDRIRPIAEKAGWALPEMYSGADDAYLKLLARDDIDAVIIATPWQWHARMAIDAMKAGKYAGVEVPAALSIDECWELIDTFEKTGTPCMMFENWAFRRDNLAVLNMIRQGLFGQIVHGHCSYSHDCMHWFFDPKGNSRWSGEHLVDQNTCQYVTHGLGPMLSWMDINAGDRIESLTATATGSFGIQDQLRRKHGDDHPSVRQEYAQGDIVTTVARTVGGKTLVINNDLTLPRPYDNRWLIQGTGGIYDEPRGSVYLEGVSPKSHQWEPFAPYEKKYEHPWWKNLSEKAKKVSHAGTDYVVMREFLRAVRRGTQTPLDVYDAATMSAISPLTARSIAEGNTPVPCPDFTRGKWEKLQNKFAPIG